MFSERIELLGHIIDSSILPRVPNDSCPNGSTSIERSADACQVIPGALVKDCKVYAEPGSASWPYEED